VHFHRRSGSCVPFTEKADLGEDTAINIGPLLKTFGQSKKFNLYAINQKLKVLSGAFIHFSLHKFSDANIERFQPVACLRLPARQTSLPGASPRQAQALRVPSSGLTPGPLRPVSAQRCMHRRQAA